MIDFQQSFRDTIAPFNGQPIAGTGSLSIWTGVFARMLARLQLDGATPEQCQQFKAVIDKAIDGARDNELSHEERSALRDVLSTAFDGIVRPIPGDLAPKADFLNGVVFSA
ncbi:MAG TPA: hypothetical protein VI837_11780 [Blastocatellia bacterium]|nr:hypothetical protein [Blastocatellia bacterium]